jgi:hypothetical protein
MKQKVKKIYHVIVGNVGTMEYTSKKLAIDCYKTYATLSKNNTGRSAGEDVCIMVDGEILTGYDFIGTNNKEL